MLPYVQAQIKAGAERIRIDFAERKGNGFSYFTFIGNDGVQQLRLWLNERENWIKNNKVKLRPEAQNAIFITRTGEPMTEAKFQKNFTCQLYRKGIKTKPYEVVTHQLRKIFKTEASPPERNINREIVEFMMGHKGDIGSSGGTYDQSPYVIQKMVEKEYQKLEPFLNLYSEKVEQPGESEALKQIEQLQARMEKEQAQARMEKEQLQAKIEKIEQSTNLLAVLKVLGFQDAAQLIDNYEKRILRKGRIKEENQ
jgi:hypothetical protein